VFVKDNKLMKKPRQESTSDDFGVFWGDFSNQDGRFISILVEAMVWTVSRMELVNSHALLFDRFQ
jgi:hypothetical protein